VIHREKSENSVNYTHLRGVLVIRALFKQFGQRYDNNNLAKDSIPLGNLKIC
jgi:hypothetical protein